jgi:ABC-type uncharacterized transport system substrate-binding protein
MKPLWCSLFVITQLFYIFSNSYASPHKQNLHIAMVLWRGETEAERGFKAGMQELGYSVNYSSFDAGQELKKLGQVFQEISKDIGQYDYVYTFGTTVSRRAKVIISERVPQIFNAVTDPVGAGIVESMTSPGKGIGGVSDSIPSALQIRAILEVMKVKKLGLFFNPREKNSMLIRDEFYQHARDNNFEIIDFRSPPAANLLEHNLQQLVDHPTLVDAVFFPSDSFLASRAHYIGAKLKEARIPSFGSLKEYIQGGLLMGFVVDYFSLGRAAAAIIDKHQKGSKLQDIPVVLPSEHPLYINKSTKELLAFRISSNLMKTGVFYQ